MPMWLGSSVIAKLITVMLTFLSSLCMSTVTRTVMIPASFPEHKKDLKVSALIEIEKAPTVSTLITKNRVKVLRLRQ